MNDDRKNEKVTALQPVYEAPSESKNEPATASASEIDRPLEDRIGYHVPDKDLSPAEAKADDFHRRRLLATYAGFQSKITSTEDRMDLEKLKWDEIHDVEERLPRYSSQWFYWPFMAILTIGEIPLNKLSFELFFQESPLMSLVVAGVVGLVLIALAHRIGVVMRHFAYAARGSIGRLSVQILQIAILAGVVGALIYGVSVLRQGYLTFIAQPDLGFAELLQSNQIGEAAQMVLGVGLGTEGWIFLVINAAILLVGISAAFFCHDPHPDFEKVDRAHKKHMKKLAKIKQKLAEQQAVELRRYANVRHRLKAG
jgi:hypothetical protein